MPILLFICVFEVDPMSTSTTAQTTSLSSQTFNQDLLPKSPLTYSYFVSHWLYFISFYKGKIVFQIEQSMLQKYSNLLQLLPEPNITKINGKVLITLPNGDNFIDRIRRKSLQLKTLVSQRGIQLESQYIEKKKMKESGNEQKIKKLLLQPNFESQQKKEKIKKKVSYLVRKKQDRSKSIKTQKKTGITMTIKKDNEKQIDKSSKKQKRQNNILRSVTQPVESMLKYKQTFKLKKKSFKLRLQEQSPTSSINKNVDKNTRSNKDMRGSFAVTLQNNFSNSSFYINLKVKESNESQQKTQEGILAPLVRIILPSYKKKEPKNEIEMLSTKKKQRFFSVNTKKQQGMGFTRSKTDEFTMNDLCGWEHLVDENQQYRT